MAHGISMERDVILKGMDKKLAPFMNVLIFLRVKMSIIEVLLATCSVGVRNQFAWAIFGCDGNCSVFWVSFLVDWSAGVLNTIV